MYVCVCVLVGVQSESVRCAPLWSEPVQTSAATEADIIFASELPEDTVLHHVEGNYDDNTNMTFTVEQTRAWVESVVRLLETQPGVFGLAVDKLTERWPKLNHSQKAGWLSTRPADMHRRKWSHARTHAGHCLSYCFIHKVKKHI